MHLEHREQHQLIGAKSRRWMSTEHVLRDELRQQRELVQQLEAEHAQQRDHAVVRASAGRRAAIRRALSWLQHSTLRRGWQRWVDVTNWQRRQALAQRHHEAQTSQAVVMRERAMRRVVNRLRRTTLQRAWRRWVVTAQTRQRQEMALRHGEAVARQMMAECAAGWHRPAPARGRPARAVSADRTPEWTLALRL